MSKTKNIPFFKWDALQWAGQEAAFLFSKTQISEFSILQQFPKFLKDTVPRSFSEVVT